MWKVCRVSKRFILIDNNPGIAVIKSCKELGSNRNRIWNCWPLRRRGKPESSKKKPFTVWTRTNNKLNLQIASLLRFELEQIGYDTRQQSFLGLFIFVVPPTDFLTLCDLLSRSVPVSRSSWTWPISSLLTLRTLQKWRGIECYLSQIVQSQNVVGPSSSFNTLSFSFHVIILVLYWFKWHFNAPGEMKMKRLKLL